MHKVNLGVQKKVSCIFKTEVIEETSKKRAHQSYKVVATSKLKDAALEVIESAWPSEKLDGTCCYIRDYNGKTWLWARLDRKPNKSAEKRFKKHQNSERGHQLSSKGEVTEVSKFTWDLKEDFKSVPVDWIPATQVKLNADGEALPDDIGHTPGWVPVDQTSRQHCWHLQCVDLTESIALFLLIDQQENCMNLVLTSMEKFSDKTLELVGTHVNGNPYKVGSKAAPIHFLVPHGEIGFRDKPPTSYLSLEDWYESCDGQVEGIVWHCNNGDIFKCHRHHHRLQWPVDNARLNTLPVKVISDIPNCESFPRDSGLFRMIEENSGETFPCLSHLKY